MLDKITGISEYFIKVPVAFLIAIVSVLALILFLPEEIAKTVAVFEFRNNYRVYLGPLLLLSLSFSLARFFVGLRLIGKRRKQRKGRKKELHRLTPEEKGYLVVYIHQQKNSIYVGLEDGIMAGLVAKGFCYQASSMGNILSGFAFNLNPWVRDYLGNNTDLLHGCEGGPLTPEEKKFGNSVW